MSDEACLAAAQRHMLEHHLRARGIHDPRVLTAMERVPREEFVPEGLRDLAYDDRALPIELGQTISQPFTVAFMAQAARLRPHERVLEIGTGTGYGAAVLSQLAAEIFTVERLGVLYESARERLARLGFDNVHVKLRDGTLGWPEASSFDAIIVTAAAEQLPTAYGDQLAEGGRLIIPIGDRATGQTMFRFKRRGNRLKAKKLGAFSFVPLVGEQPLASEHYDREDSEHYDGEDDLR